MTRQPRIERIAALSLALSSLGGCNMAVSSRPLLPYGRPAAALLAPGDWIGIAGDCRDQEARAPGAPPACADRFTVQGGRVIDGKRPAPIVIVRLNAGARTGLAQIDLGNRRSRAPLFGYAGFAVEARAADGRISQFRAWPVLCRLTPSNRHARPLPGLAPRTKDSNCTASSRRTLEVAAARSRPTAPKTEFRRLDRVVAGRAAFFSSSSPGEGRRRLRIAEGLYGSSD